MRISDWSSDVCSSDLDVEQGVAVLAAGQADHDLVAVIDHAEVGDRATDLVAPALGQLVWYARGLLAGSGAAARSEERSEGKECVSTCKSRWATEHSK